MKITKDQVDSVSDVFLSEGRLSALILLKDMSLELLVAEKHLDEAFAGSLHARFLRESLIEAAQKEIH